MNLLTQDSGLAFEVLAHGALRRMAFDAGTPLWINAYPGNALEGGPANLWLRWRAHPAQGWRQTPLLGPRSPLRFAAGAAQLEGRGRWQGLQLLLQLRLLSGQAAWCWTLEAEGPGDAEWVLVQDLGLAAPGAVRLNEYYLSHYLDLQPLDHPRLGACLAVRQNQAQAGGRHPWLLAAGLRRVHAYATDLRQLVGPHLREHTDWPPLHLPAQRLQHEHAVAALQQPLPRDADGCLRGGFVLQVEAHHAEPSSAADLARLDALLPRCGPAAATPMQAHQPLQALQALQATAPSLFASAPLLDALPLAESDPWLAGEAERRHVERDARGRLLAFFHGDQGHTVLRAKELAVQRPHGHLLRAGHHLVPDETALTSTAWMGGVFHSLLTQGHVGSNRLLSTQRSQLGLFRSQGLRLFVDFGSGWQLLGTPSAWEVQPQRLRWLYVHAQGRLEVRAEAGAAPDAMRLDLRVLEGPPCALLASLHLALDGDDGLAAEPPPRLEATGPLSWRLAPAPGSAMAARFPGGAFALQADAVPLALGDDALLYPDGRSRGEPLAVLRWPAARQGALVLRGELLAATPPAATGIRLPRWTPARDDAAVAQLQTLQPWLLHNALVHYLSPRGLEQFSGGGWGTRDVAQGPLELLLAFDHLAPARDLLLRLFAAQIPSGAEAGDWPQWFMFFARDAHIRAGDQHGDIVLWPLLALAQYLSASGDAALLDAPLPAGGQVRDAVQRSLALMRRRVVPGTVLPSYWHGDWNDSLQPADGSLRERLCSAWTVTLHHQTLSQLGRALARLGQPDASLQQDADAVADAFRRDLLADGVVAGYAHYAADGQAPQLWLHPRDRLTGLRYSLLPMMHAVLAELLTPEEAQAQLALIEERLLGPDGARLFDAPLPYQGGRTQRFQRAETSSFFGREIGVMYMHAHLRWAQTLAHLGRAQALQQALQQAHAIELQQRLPQASLRQSNCYYSSSDAAFPDRYAAHHDYARLLAGEVALDGGWRVYSSGPGIFLALLVQQLLGVRLEHQALLLDPVMPAAWRGLHVELTLADCVLDLHFEPGPLGCGVQHVLDDEGHALPFERRPNRYRAGAAALPRPQAGSRLQLHVHTA